MNNVDQKFLLEKISEELVEPAAEPDLGSSISRLLQLHLDELAEWKHRWTDGLLDIRLHRHNGSIDLLANVVLVKGDGLFWMDPLEALFSINNRGKITRYELRFEDQDRPSEPYKVHRKHEPSHLHRWSYRFTNDDA
jgi:hypothetical protein